MTPYARLCALLDEDAELASSVIAAEADGNADIWASIIDGLDDAGALAYLDAADTGVQLADALAGVPRVFRSGADMDAVADVDGELDGAIIRADSILARHGLRIVYLDEQSGAYPLVVVPLENVDEILTLTHRLGHGARVFG